MYVVIMAGGKGTRLWPMSRELRPKQFQALVSERSLLEETYERVRAVAAPEEIFISTTGDLADLCREQLPELPHDNVLIEPVGRNTGPAIGLVAAWFAQRDPNAIVATVASDHVIGRPEQFSLALRIAHDTVSNNPEMLMTIGLQPTWGNPGFGYIKADVPEGLDDPELQVLQVDRFVEKPTPEVARQYVDEGGYYWNASYFIFRADTMLSCIERYDPALHQGLGQIQQAIGSPGFDQTLQEVYAQFASVPIDTLVFEPESEAHRVLVIPASLEWEDLGNWQTLSEKLREWTGEDVITRGEVVSVGSHRCLVFGTGDRLIATLGLEDVIIVDTPDALLIARTDMAQDVKAILGALNDDDPRR